MTKPWTRALLKTFLDRPRNRYPNLFPHLEYTMEAIAHIKNSLFFYKLRTLSFVEEILLYDSRAKGQNTERSDIDLAIVCPEASKTDWQTVRDIIDHADTLLKIDCLRLDQLEDARLREAIYATKVVLFKRVKNTYVWYDLFLDLGEALDKFSEVLKVKAVDFPYAVEATLQVFEHSFELYWKLFKKYALMKA